MLRTSFLAAVALAASVPANAANLIVNGGFETGALTPWTASDNPVVTTDQANTGQFSVAAFASDGIFQGFAATATADITEVSFWVLREGGPFDGVGLSYDDNTETFFVINRIGSVGWQFFDVTDMLEAGKNLTGFRIFGTSPGPAYFDDFVIETAAIPEPASWAMMIGGFALAGASLRRDRRARAAIA